MKWLYHPSRTNTPAKARSRIVAASSKLRPGQWHTHGGVRRGAHPQPPAERADALGAALQHLGKSPGGDVQTEAGAQHGGAGLYVGRAERVRGLQRVAPVHAAAALPGSSPPPHQGGGRFARGVQAEPIRHR